MLMNSAVRLLDRAAGRWPSRPALEDETGEYSYADYRTLARRVASGVLSLGIGSLPVVVCLQKSARVLISFMGAMYAGCPYAPVDAAAPPARLEKIVGSLRPGLLISEESRVAELETAFPGIPVRTFEQLAETQPDDAAVEAAVGAVTDSDPIYIIYTSGSTGTPKGVTIPHRGVLSYARWLRETFGFSPETVMANQAPFYFDNSVLDIYGSLYSGAKLIITPEVLFKFPLKLPEFLRDRHVSSILWVPTVMIHVANSGALDSVSLPELKTVCFAGEVMPNKQLNVWRRALPDTVFANLYGPTETDVCCCYIVEGEYADSDALPIGRACGNMRALVLTPDGREAGEGEMGELCVIGSGITLGYWNEPELTARSLVPNPLRGSHGEPMYRTGDLAIRRADGLLMFCGRKDFQIKLKGNRIELGEIEAAAVCVPGVENAAAIFSPEEEKIYLFAECPDAEKRLSLRRFNLELRRYVPAYMLPGELRYLDALPHTANDKIDRVGLKRSINEERETDS